MPPRLPAALRNTRSARYLFAFVSVALLAACGPEKKDESPKVFEGVSGHWNQQEIPVSMQCGACHAQEFRDWAASDHAWAFRELQAKHDAQPFHGQKFDNGVETLAFRTGSQGRRLIGDPDTKQTWEARFALGRIPLVQYLVPAADGGYHTTSAAWDVHEREWFDVFGKDARPAGNWGHWRGRGMNWNTQCAWCHMSDYRKNYDPEKDRYTSTWREPGVTCIQCHPLAAEPDAKTGCMIGPKEQAALSPKQMRDNCASCHARREELDDAFRAGRLFDDHFRLELPVREGVFWPNGMQRDEDYCETGLRLSRMGQAGVTCLDCHDPHTATLKLTQEDNAVCLRCHAVGTLVGKTKAPVIDIATHTPCPQGSKGGRCVECHMPESPYMARDPRRDHSFNSPDPQLSVELGIPNACTMCHRSMSDEKAAETVAAFYRPTHPNTLSARQRTRAIQHAWQGRPGAAKELLDALNAEENGAWQATLLDHLGEESSAEPALVAETVAAARRAQSSPEPLARAAAARLLAAWNHPDARKALTDPVRVVRRDAGWSLRRELPRDHRAVQEAVAAARHQSDQPPGAMKLATLAEEAGHIREAETWYSRAAAWDPSGIVAKHDFALFLARLGRNAEALQQLEAAAALAPKDADLQFKQALCLLELKRTADARRCLDKAVDLDPRFARALYNRAILKNGDGDAAGALEDLQRCGQIEPGNPEYPFFEALIHHRAGNSQEALKAALRANAIAPRHQATLQLLQEILADPAVRKANGL